MQTNVLISQDLSGVGQVSMGVALPLIAVMGHRPWVLPTAYLSAHTGFAGNTYLDLADAMPPALAHWQTLGLAPDGLLLGYLGAPALAVWQQWLPRYREVPVRVVDPVMGDGGKLYRGFDADYVEAMQALVQEATVITPNPTEAQLLLNEPPTAEAVWQQDAASALAERVAARFHVAVVLTGITLPRGMLGVVVVAGNDVHELAARKLAGQYFGTGDLFASVLCGALVRGEALVDAATLAQGFVSRAIVSTLADAADAKFGVNYMDSLPWLLAQL